MVCLLDWEDAPADFPAEADKLLKDFVWARPCPEEDALYFYLYVFPGS